MANISDITVNLKRGYINGSYNMHQEVSAKTIGVLKYNNDFRKKLLERNIGKYALLNLDEGIGYISDFYSNLSSKPFSFDGNGLLGYTHIGNPSSLSNGNPNKKQFSQMIEEKYDLDDVKYYYQHGSLPDSNALRWNGKYRDYTEYLNSLYGISLTPFGLLTKFFEDNKLPSNLTGENINTIQSVLNDFLQYDNIKYAMEKSRIGTINPNPLMALLGAVTTNISSFSGKDTQLGMITNQVYANMLHKGAIFNSLRKTQYITPDVYEKLGNKLTTIATIGADFRINEDIGRFTHDFSEGKGKVIELEDKDFNDYFNSFGEDLTFVYDENDSTLNNDIFRAKTLNKNYENKADTFFEVYIYPYLPFKDRQYKEQTEFKKRVSWEDEKDNTYIPYNNYENYDLLGKTDALFKQGKINTLINRYYNGHYDENNVFETAVTKGFGLSHGRNLLTVEGRKNNTITNDGSAYNNPYCRVWTSKKSYDNLKDLIRPFSNEDGFISVDKLQENLKKHIRTEKGLTHLNDNTSLNSNGFVNITPNNWINGIESVKKCMFSIENLAWKDYAEDINLSKEQQGPNGGRIMWFPPYDLKFNEQVGVNWNGNEFIGRGEKIYTYTNTDRTGTLSFILLVDNPSIVSEWIMQGEKETRDEEQEQQLLRFFAGCEQLTLGDRKEVGYKEITYTKTQDYEEVSYDYPLKPEVNYIDEDIIFYIYFPNNYSGVDDDFDDAIKYLIYTYDKKTTDDLLGSNPLYQGYDWEYRVDKAYINAYKGDKTKYKNGYFKDNNDYELNYSLKKVNNDTTNSLRDIYENHKNILSGKTITNVKVESGVTKIGSSNSKLLKNRLKFGEKFLKNVLGYQVKLDDEKDMIEINLSDYILKNVSHLKSKASRYVKIILKTRRIDYTKSLDNDIKYFIYKDKTSDELNEMLLNEYEKKLSSLPSIVLEENEESKTKMINYALEKYKLSNEFINNPLRDFVIKKRVENKTKNITGTTVTSSVIDKSLSRNDFGGEERLYFEMLREHDNLTYTNLAKKIKYFNPAFHSITPEGFNSRLSFLHQCTRQGPTLGTSEYNENRKDPGGNDLKLKSAGNLAFGRPPICVLRIGDFYNTKVIINSLTIDFNDSTLDMNPEGIGVQPMFARVTLNFTFLGGSDLGGPISRLQNALSFNYYANQSIYDKRAIMTEYYDKNVKIKGEAWYPNKEN